MDKYFLCAYIFFRLLLDSNTYFGGHFDILLDLVKH